MKGISYVGLPPPLAKALAAASLDTVPLNDESARPLLLAFMEFAKANANGLTIFDQGPPGAPQTKFYLGILGPLAKVAPLLAPLQSMLLEKFGLDHVAPWRPVCQLFAGGQGLIFFDRIWIPADALGTRRH